MTYNLILTPKGKHETLIVPVKVSYAEAITMRDTCLAEMAKGTQEAAHWADIDVVVDGWPGVNIFGVV